MPFFVRMAMPPIPIFLLLSPVRLVKVAVFAVMLLEVVSVRPLLRLVPLVSIVMSLVFVVPRLTVVAPILGPDGRWYG